MAKFDLKSALSALAQTATGMAQGQIAAQQELRRRELQRQEQAQQFYGTLLSNAKLFDPASQQNIVASALQGYGNIAAGRPLDFSAGAPPIEKTVPFQPPPAPAQAAAPGEFAQFVQALPGPQAPPALPAAPLAQQGPPVPLAGPTPGAGAMFQPMPPVAAPARQPGVPGFTERVAPAAPVAAAPPPVAPAERPGFRVAGVPGELRLRGVDPKEAKSIVDKIDKELQSLDFAYKSDPAAIVQIQKLAQGRPTKVPETPEEYQAAQQYYSGLLSQTVGLRAAAPAGKDYTARLQGLEKQLERLPHYSDADLPTQILRVWDEREALEKESAGRAIVPGGLVGQRRNIEAIREAMAAGDEAHAARLSRKVANTLQSPMKPDERRRAVSAFLADLARQNPETATDPAFQRALAEQHGVTSFIEAIEPGTLKFGGEDLERRWEVALKRVMGGQKLSPGAQKLAFDELLSLARLTDRKVTVTAKELFALPPDVLEKMQRERTRFNIDVTKHQWDVADRGLRRRKLELGLDKLEESIKQAKGGKLSAQDRWIRSAEFQKLNNESRRAWDAYQSHLTRADLVEGDFDPARPGSDRAEKAAARLYENAIKADRERDKFIIRQGHDPGTIQRLGESEDVMTRGPQTGKLGAQVEGLARGLTFPKGQAPSADTAKRTALPRAPAEDRLTNEQRIYVMRGLIQKYQKRGLSRAEARARAEREVSAFR